MRLHPKVCCVAFIFAICSFLPGFLAAESPLPIDAVSEAVFRIEVKKGAGLSRGTAFMIHPSGILATCHHVVEGGKEYSLVDKNGKRTSCRVAWSIPQYDVAFLMVSRGEYPALRLANRRLTDKNERVFGIFNMLGEGMVSLRGFLSHPSYNIRLESYTIPDGYLLDIPTEGGASGGPLLSADGEVLGVLSGTRGRQSTLALVVPASYIEKAAQLTMNLKSERGLATGMTLETRDDGLYVSDVAENSPAVEAGVRPDDKIVGVDTWGVRNTLDYFFSEIAFCNANKDKPLPVRVFTRESGEIWTVDVRLESWKYAAVAPTPPDLKPGCRFQLKISDAVGIKGMAPNMQSLFPKAGSEVKYTGFIELPENGRFVFTLQPPGAGTLRVGDDFVIEKSHSHPAMEVTRSGFFEKGAHRFELVYKMDKFEEKPPLKVSHGGKIITVDEAWLRHTE